MRDRSELRARWLLLAAAVAALLVAGTGSGAVRQIGSVTLTVQFSGNGAGTVSQTSGPGTGTPQGINCTNPAPGLGNVCTESFPFGAPPQPFVGLTVSSPPGSEFVGWSVEPQSTPSFECQSEAECYVQMSSNVTVTAQFVPLGANIPLTVTRKGSGAQSGVVTSSPTGIACGFAHPDCATSFPPGTFVTLTASTVAGATFAGWGGACSSAGTSATCTLLLTSAANAVASFNAPQQQLSVDVTGSGGVASNVQPGISCPSACTASFAQGTKVSLYASAAANYQFTGWSGACSGTGVCTVTMSSAQNVTATFTQLTQPLSVSVTTAGGTVASAPAGISCPVDCLGTYPQGSQVTLTAAAKPGYAFSGWGGACSGTTATCTVTMSQAQQATASFARTPVAATLVSARVTTNGPSAARRVVTVTVRNAQTVGINIKLLRLCPACVQVTSVTYRGVAAGTHAYRLLVRNVTKPGPLTVYVTFTNVAKTTKTQNKRVALPPLPKK